MTQPQKHCFRANQCQPSSRNALWLSIQVLKKRLRPLSETMQKFYMQNLLPFVNNVAGYAWSQESIVLLLQDQCWSQHQYCRLCHQQNCTVPPRPRNLDDERRLRFEAAQARCRFRGQGLFLNCQ